METIVDISTIWGYKKAVSAIPPPSSRYKALLQLLRTADTLWNASRVFFSQWDLSPSQFNVLNLLAGHPGGLSQIELGRLMLTHRSNVTGLVDRLMKRRLVQRKDDPADRRAYRVSLTESGAKLVHEILPEFHGLAESVWGDSPLPRVKQVAATLAALADHVQSTVKSEDGL